MKYKKLKILEFIILITIITSIIVILLFAKNVLSKKPKISNTNTIQNYSVTRYHEYAEDFFKSTIYNYPMYTQDIGHNSYYVYITSTDNLINTITEKITISYLPLLPEDETIIKNYCNTYDKIEYEYKFQCTYKDKHLTLRNTFYIDRLKSNTIIKDNITIEIPIKKNTLLSEYLVYLTNNNYFPIEVESIK